MNTRERQELEYQMKCGILKALRQDGRLSEQQYHAAMDALRERTEAAA